jgi:hypothetical protein
MVEHDAEGEDIGHTDVAVIVPMALPSNGIRGKRQDTRHKQRRSTKYKR